MTAKVSLVVAVASLLGGCRACTFEEGERVYERVDGAVHIEVVRQSSRGPAAIFSNVGFVLRVSTSPPFDEWLPQCMVEKYAIGEDPTGKLIAFRCDMAGSSWHLLRVGSSGAHVVDCSNDLGVMPKPDFTKARPLADVAPEIVACHEKGEGTGGRALADVYAALEDLLREVGGAPAVRTFFAKTSDREVPHRADEDPEEPWMAAMSKLPPAEREAVERDLCTALTNPASDTAYVRAARRCTLDDPRVGEAALERVRTALTTGPKLSTPSKWPSALDWAMPIATMHKPADAGAAACAFVASASPDDRREELAFTAIAVSKTKCAAMRTLSPVPCNSWLDCDAGLCTASELQGSFDSWHLDKPESTDAGVRTRAPSRPRHDPVLAAMYASGPLPREMVLRNARRHYELDLGIGPSCDTAQGAGTPCHCTTLPWETPELCNIPLDGGRLVVEHCSLRADDREKRVGWVEHVGPDGDF